LTSTHDPMKDAGGRLDRQTLDAVYSVAYEELRRIAKSVKYSGPVCTLTPSTLVQEAWLRLAKSRTLALYSEIQFKFIAAEAMYQILVEAARRRSTEKRGANKVFISFDDSLGVSDCCSRDVLALRDALDELEQLNHRQAEMVKSRYFGGLDNTEIASLLGVSKATVDRDWRATRAWLRTKIPRGMSGAPS
jgi:RNA polymerase sigma factor (TIGR02999 family)